VIAVIGAVLLVVSYAALDWAHPGNDKFSTLHHYASQPGAPGYPHAFFGWLGWVLLVVAVVLALAANAPTAAHGFLRGIGFVVGVGAAIATFLALKTGSTFSAVFHHGGIGFWLAIVAFLITGIGALVGPAEDRTKPLPR
jgi:hypothetical protein